MEQISVNMTPKGIKPVCHSSQYDKGRIIRLNLVDGIQGYTLTGEETLELEVRKPDNNIVTAEVQNTSSNYVLIVTTEQMTACEGDSNCEIRVRLGDTDIGSINFILRVEEDPLKDGIESETEIHNLHTQIEEINAEIIPGMVAEEVAHQYSGDVIFDNEPTENHGEGYAVTSKGLKNYVPKTIDELDDVEINNPQANQAIVYNPITRKFENGEVSTVGGLNDLNDVTLENVTNKQELVFNEVERVFENKTTRVELTQAEYDQLVEDDEVLPDVDYYITDAPSMQGTSADLSYDGSTKSVYTKIGEIESDISGIVESGSNANGYYIKYKDGSMICTKTASVEVLNTAWSDWGVLKEATNLSLGDFAETFYQVPIVSLSLSGDAAWLERISGTTVSSAGTISILRPNSPGRTTNYSVSVIAVGRWKA